MLELSGLRYSLAQDISLPKHRTPEEQGSVRLPAGCEIVSSDNHWSIADDIWFQGFPARLKERAPRVWNDGRAWQIGFGGKSLFPEAVAKVFGSFEPIPGAIQLESRIRDLTIEGVNQEIVFGNGVNAFLAHPDFEIREWVFRVYNQYIAELGAQAPGRFHGVGIPNYWNMAQCRDSVRELQSLGLKTMMLPQNPGTSDAGEEMKYASGGDGTSVGSD